MFNVFSVYYEEALESLNYMPLDEEYSEDGIATEGLMDTIARIFNWIMGKLSKLKAWFIQAKNDIKAKLTGKSVTPAALPDNKQGGGGGGGGNKTAGITTKAGQIAAGGGVAAAAAAASGNSGSGDTRTLGERFGTKSGNRAGGNNSASRDTRTLGERYGKKKSGSGDTRTLGERYGKRNRNLAGGAQGRLEDNDDGSGLPETVENINKSRQRMGSRNEAVINKFKTESTNIHKKVSNAHNSVREFVRGLMQGSEGNRPTMAGTKDACDRDFGEVKISMTNVRQYITEFTPENGRIPDIYPRQALNIWNGVVDVLTKYIQMLESSTLQVRRFLESNIRDSSRSNEYTQVAANEFSSMMSDAMSIGPVSSQIQNALINMSIASARG